MVDLETVKDFARRVWDPSSNNKGLPFGSLLHSAPPRRHRTLTGPPEPAQESLWHKLQVFSAVQAEQHSYLQEQCGFLSKLPLDIRMMVYDMVLGGMAFHIDTPVNESSNRIMCYICRQPDKIDDENDQNHHTCYAPSKRRSSTSPREEYEQATGLLPLLVSCRRIYSEAIETLYNANTFEFWKNQVAFRFLKSMVPPQRLHSIRRFRWSMRIPHHPLINNRSQRDWSDLFSFFANETCGLQHLYLNLRTNHPIQTLIRQTRDDEADGWIRPMILMAIDANRKRGCKVEIVTEHVVHEPVSIYNAVAHANPSASYDTTLRMASAEMHRRIRLSLDTPG